MVVLEIVVVVGTSVVVEIVVVVREVLLVGAALVVKRERVVVDYKQSVSKVIE